MSAAGQLALRAQQRILERAGLRKPGDVCSNPLECEKEERAEDPDGRLLGIQSETAISASPDGQHIVMGFNDFRGFIGDPSLPLSISGFMYSDDGGATFVDGGQLPITTEVSVIGGDMFPQVFGDPDVKNLGGCNFVFSSIVVTKFTATTVVQTMGVHRSTDCGHTWEGPFEVTAASNPNGGVENGEPLDAADKELLDVNRQSNRVLLAWTNFTPFAPGFVEMSTTYSDDVLTATPPTWSTRAVVSAIENDGQGMNPRFGRGNNEDAYVAWRRFSDTGQVIAFARSKDGGATWKNPIELSGGFFPNDEVLGNDRIHAFPWVGVDLRGSGRNSGNIYVVYAGNDNHDGADIYFQRSNNGGAHFSAPVLLNSRPGNDSSQWFPVVAVDNDSGRVFVHYYDQQIARTGDLTENTFTFSDDGGRSWNPPQPLLSSTLRPWHAGWGNDTSQPNLGDYNDAVVRNHTFLASRAVTAPQDFTSGQPNPFFDVPVTELGKVTPAGQVARVTVSLEAIGAADSGGNGFIDPGETVTLAIPLTNYVTNPLNRRTFPLVIAVVSSSTAGVTVTQPVAIYLNLTPGSTRNSIVPVQLQLSPAFVAGTDIELAVTAFGITGLPLVAPTTLRTSIHTGTPVATPLLVENFDAAVPGTLPAGWASVHGAGLNVVPWTTSTGFCGSTSQAAFHVNANDGPPMMSPARWERLLSPAFAVPADAEYVIAEFDVCYDTEDDPAFNILGYDGFFLRITDLTPGHLVRSNLIEAFETEFTTGDFNHYPKHFPRNGEPGYFPQGDMSAWAGESQVVQHVRLRLPGMAGTIAQLRFEFTQDGLFTCADVRPGHSCGVTIDNLVVSSVVSQ